LLSPLYSFPPAPSFLPLPKLEKEVVAWTLGDLRDGVCCMAETAAELGWTAKGPASTSFYYDGGMALFPLPLVLFPGAILPLQIFEFRYRIMMHTLLETDLYFGVVFSDAGSVAGIDCVGEVVKHERLVDNRFFLICKGQEQSTTSMPHQSLRSNSSSSSHSDALLWCLHPPFFCCPLPCNPQWNPPCPPTNRRQGEETPSLLQAGEEGWLRHRICHLERQLQIGGEPRTLDSTTEIASPPADKKNSLCVDQWLLETPVSCEDPTPSTQCDLFLNSQFVLLTSLLNHQDAVDLRRGLFPTPFSIFVGCTFEGAPREQQALLELQDTGARLRRERETLRNTLNYCNLWRELWETVKPLPAAKQAPLFDEDLAV
ncbi:hypothetical protein Taro_047356, partial [Colocasia esculenta]|nr:hypothetical protein [Colocasia esculenta]